MPRPTPPPAPAPSAAPARCASCEREIAPIDAATCAICKRAVHLSCVKPYGHHMLACEECRLETW